MACKHREALYNRGKTNGIGAMNSPSSEPDQGNFFFHSSDETQSWQNIQLSHMRHPAGECDSTAPNDHILSLSLAPRPVHLLQKQDDKTYTGMYGKGDMVITPAQSRFFARWETDDHLLQIRLSDQFLRTVATESLNTDPDRISLITEFRTRNTQVEAIAMMLLAELEQNQPSSQLYIDSLANIFTVNLLRQYTTKKPKIKTYEGGLPPHQLSQILDYIDSSLEQDIKLADLAQLLDMSQFHFGRLFKQSIGRSPYQYLIQQRVERAKRLLKNTDYLITDIALECGFNSHSHLTNKFRKMTGMTPKAFRVN
ncbi:helix-turn-helix transcriptional regulator [[Limnothrix rosea] IAM M-220]|uniref:helix-turn-helix transcriptional regulator n=1 Tax=[Limnothrix rosea] IAM M-220 TaxID=454133 RepID=UPI000965C0D6|nr:helix-turn-helix domain-containing protein [[Limnothrix rosea] IAM M-220]OKH18959.1 AraC family transcriptional regulator [[Limnothrix rosea] IAM M-220]